MDTTTVVHPRHARALITGVDVASSLGYGNLYGCTPKYSSDTTARRAIRQRHGRPGKSDGT